MFKKVYVKLGLVVMLLLATLLSVSVLAQADDAATNTITVEFEADRGVAVKVYYKIGDKETEEYLQSGVPKAIPAGTANVQLKLILTDGWDVDEATDGTVDIFKPDDLIYDFGVGLTEDKTITVKTKPMVYNINYIRTTPEGTASLEGAPVQHTYNTLTVIPNPTLPGYTFVKWLILPSMPDESFDASIYTDELKPGGGGVFVELPAKKVPIDSAKKSFYLYPVWTPITYPVYCRDVIFTGDLDNPIGYRLKDKYLVGEFEAGTTVYGNNGAFVQNGVNYVYRGFEFNEEITLQCEKGAVTVMANDQTNIVYRFYTALSYDIEYECSAGNNGLNLPNGSTPLPTTHVYDMHTILSEPILTGYIFAGWKVEVFNSLGVWEDVSSLLSRTAWQASVYPNLLSAYSNGLDTAFHSEPSDEYDGRRVIRITALWEPKEFEIHYNLMGPVDQPFDTDAFGMYIYNTDLVIPNPVRKGYEFLGWTLNSGNVADQYINAENGFTTLPAKSYTDQITLVARWQAKSYNVTFDGCGADASCTFPNFSVTYDQPFVLPSDFAIPTKEGHDFKGFSADAAGTQMLIDENGAVLVPIWQIDGDTVLYAQWEARSYTVVITDPNQSFFGQVLITVNGQAYNGETLTFKYGDTITVVVQIRSNGTVYNAYKLVQWRGAEDSAPAPIDHTYVYTYTFQLGAHDTELTGVVAPLRENPNLRVDYLTETLVTQNGKLPNGAYRVMYGQTELLVEVQNGVVYITENGMKKQYASVKLGDSAFGSALTVIVCGDGVNDADSDPITINLSPRPAAPVLDSQGKGEIEYVYSHDDTKIVVQMTKPVDLSRYEFAISTSDQESNVLRWYVASELTSAGDGAVMFENLKPGTPYYVFVRLKAVANDHPHGETQVGGIQRATTSDMTIAAKKQELDALRETADGDVLKALIDRVKAELDALNQTGASPDFENKMNAILEQVSSSKVAFARTQDLFIKNLTEYYNALVGSGYFNETNLATLGTIYTVSVSAIQSSTSSDAARLAYDAAVLQMSEIRVTYLFNDILHLTSQNSSLPQGLMLQQLRREELTTLLDLLNASIDGERVVANGNYITVEEAQDLAETLELIASYSMQLFYTQGNVAYTNFAGTYEFRMTIPSDLLSHTGLQVAYYNEKTGELTLLQTNREGNELIFTANSVQDFVIFAEPTYDVTPLLIMLGVIAALQMIAIAILLINRKKNANSVSVNGFAAAPILMAVRPIPENAMIWLLVLIGIVIVLQIVLTYLLITSRIFHRDGPRPKTEKEQPRSNGQDAMDIFDEPEGEYPVYADAVEADDDSTYEHEPSQDGAYDYESEPDYSGWSYDPETGEVFENDEQPTDGAHALNGSNENTADEEKDAAFLDEEEEDEDAVYVEPDITGDEAPLPDGYYYEED